MLLLAVDSLSGTLPVTGGSQPIFIDTGSHTGSADMLREECVDGSFPGVYRERTSIDAQTQDSFNKCFF